MNIMPIEHIPDWEKRLARCDAFWSCAVIDRPNVIMYAPKQNPEYPWPEKKFPTLRDRWMDTEYNAEIFLACAMNTEFCGDALPLAFPSLGPEVFSSFFGCEMEYGEETSWSIPNLLDWADADKIQFSEDNFYWKKTLEMTDAYLEIGKGKFYVGITDMHPGGDAIVAFRDPERLAVDMLEHLDELKALQSRVDQVYFKMMDLFFDKLQGAGQAISSWMPFASTKRWYIPSNDFSCMISKQMFDDVFLPGIAEECRRLEASIYHLDGPGALHQLDSLLEIKELNAIQWTYGTGHGSASDWLDVYKKVQAAGKGNQIYMEAGELDTIMENLRPEGSQLLISGVETKDQADAILAKVSKWR